MSNCTLPIAHRRGLAVVYWRWCCRRPGRGRTRSPLVDVGGSRPRWSSVAKNASAIDRNHELDVAIQMESNHSRIHGSIVDEEGRESHGHNTGRRPVNLGGVSSTSI